MQTWQLTPWPLKLLLRSDTCHFCSYSTGQSKSSNLGRLFLLKKGALMCLNLNTAYTVSLFLSSWSQEHEKPDWAMQENTAKWPTKD